MSALDMYNTNPFQSFAWILSEGTFYSRELNTMPTGRKMFVTVFHVRSCPFVIFHYYLDFEKSIISLLIFNCFNHNHISKIKWAGGHFARFFECAYDIIILIMFDMSWSVSESKGWWSIDVTLFRKGLENR